MILTKSADYANLCEIPALNAQKYPNRLSHKFRIGDKLYARNFEGFMQDIRALACAFRAHGVKRGDHVAFFCDNRYYWAVTDYALMACGAVSVPRGSDTSPIEQAFIYTHSDAKFLVIENEAGLKALKEAEGGIAVNPAVTFMIDPPGKRNKRSNNLRHPDARGCLRL